MRIYEDWEEARRTVLRRRDMVVFDEVPEPVRASIRRVFGEELTPDEAVARILADVRRRGDEAMRDWTARIDGLVLDTIEVPAEDWEAAHDSLPADLADALDLAAERIRAFHARQPISSLSWTTTEMGGTLGQRVTPLARVGVYVPGGAAPLPSSLLMAVIPARVAGVDEVFVCTPPFDKLRTPPGREASPERTCPERSRRSQRDGRVPDVTLAAAHIAGVDRLFRLGGAQAIGALAYGTATVPRVDKIVGAGGLFTTLAKRQVYGQVGVDGLYGPTETLVVADDSANPAWVAADLLAQAEHDVLATAILLTPSRQLAEAVQAEVARQMFPPSSASPPTLGGTEGGHEDTLYLVDSGRLLRLTMASLPGLGGTEGGHEPPAVIAAPGDTLAGLPVQELSDVALSPDGSLLVLDRSGEVIRYDVASETWHRSDWEAVAGTGGTYVTAVAADQDATYFLDTNRGQVWRVAGSQAKVVAEVPSSRGVDLVVDGENVYVLLREWPGRRPEVIKYHGPDWTKTWTISSGLDYPSALCAAADGLLYLLDSNDRRVLALDAETGKARAVYTFIDRDVTLRGC